MTTIIHVTGPRDPGLPRQPHGGEPTSSSASGAFGRAAVPSGASTGEHEAVELRDGDGPRTSARACQAVDNVNDEHRRGRHRTGIDAPDQAGSSDPAAIDLDGTPNKGQARRQRHPRRLDGRGQGRARMPGLPLYRYLGGVNAQMLPVPMMNILNGGAHADNNVDLQEFMVVPVGRRAFPRRPAHGRGDLPRPQGRAEDEGALRTAVGDEGGFAPDLSSNEDALEVILEAIEKAGYKPGKQTSASPSTRAASEFFDKRRQAAVRASGGRRPRAPPRRWSTSTRTSCDELPHHQHRGRPGRGRLGRLEAL